MTNEDRRRILDLLAQGKITVNEAEQLLSAMSQTKAEEERRSTANESPKPGARFLRVEVHKAANQWRPEKEVNIRIPISLARSGMNLASIVQGFGSDHLREHLRAKGIDLSKLDETNLEQVLKDMGELTLDVDQGKTQVRITCE
jgi:hypothetical protein